MTFRHKSSHFSRALVYFGRTFHAVPEEPIMTLQQLIYFQSVAQSGSFTKAARKHFVSQTAVSRQIQQLEKELDVSLLERNTAHVRLTVAGQFLYEQSTRICQELQQAIDQTRALNYQSCTHLTLGIPGIAEAHATNAMLRAFHQKFPQVAVQFAGGSRQELVTALVQGKIDLLITQDFDLPDLKGLASVVLAQDHFVWLLPSHHPLAARASISPWELQGEQLLIPKDLGRSTSESLLDYLSQLGLDKNPHLYTENAADAYMMLGAGFGISLILSREAFWMQPDMSCVEIAGPQCMVHLLGVTRPGCVNPNVEAFLQNPGRD